MCSKSDHSTPIMTNLNADRFYKKFTRRKGPNAKVVIDSKSIGSAPEDAASSTRMDDEVRIRDELTNRLGLGTARCAVSSVIRLLSDCVLDVSSKANCVVIVVFLLLSTVSRTTAASSSIGHVSDKVQNYLMNFGYLPNSNQETGNLRTEDQLREAIETLQEFGNIPVTGRIDRATQELLKKPRCGLPDIIPQESGRWKRFTKQGQMWNHTDLTWSLQRRPHHLDTSKVRRELSRALSVWSDNSRLTFQEVASDKADIVVSFVKGAHDDGYPFDGRGQILAHAFFPGNGRGGDAHFDEEELWLMSDAGEDEEGTSLFAVAAHEFGHSLGLSHSSVEGALMYPWYQGNKYNFQLPDDDRLGIQHMYGAKEDRMWAKIPPNLPTEPPRTTTTTRKPYQRPNYPRWPNNPDYPRYYPRPTTRPTPPPHHPYNPNKPENPRPEYPKEGYPRRPPPESPDRHPKHPVHTTTPRTYYNKPTDRRPYNPDRRINYYPDLKPRPYPDYPVHRPDNPHHPHVTRRPYYPQPTEAPHHPYPKPESPRKPHHPKKPVYPQKPYKPENRHPTEVTPPHSDGKIPDTCNMNYDAIALIRGEVFIFKSQYLWRIGAEGLVEGFPARITRMWNELPHDLTQVDAVYERPDRKIVFFIGKLYYVFDTNTLLRGYPRPLTDLGLPETLEHLNAAMVWGYNGKTYFYNETMYWKFDEEVGKVELDYPRNMSMWRGVGYDIDTVFQWKDGKTYFFKGKGFWKFNDLMMKVETEKQQSSASFWMGCPAVEDDEDFLNGNKLPYRGLPPSPTGTLLFSNANTNVISVSLAIFYASILFAFNVDLT